MTQDKCGWTARREAGISVQGEDLQGLDSSASQVLDLGIFTWKVWGNALNDRQHQ